MTPLFGGVDPVEGVDVEAVDVGHRVCHFRGEIDQQLVRPISARPHQSAGEAFVLGEELG